MGAKILANTEAEKQVSGQWLDWITENWKKVSACGDGAEQKSSQFMLQHSNKVQKLESSDTCEAGSMGCGTGEVENRVLWDTPRFSVPSSRHRFGGLLCVKID